MLLLEQYLSMADDWVITSFLFLFWLYFGIIPFNSTIGQRCNRCAFLFIRVPGARFLLIVILIRFFIDELNGFLQSWSLWLDRHWILRLYVTDYHHIKVLVYRLGMLHHSENELQFTFLRDSENVRDERVLVTMVDMKE